MPTTCKLIAKQTLASAASSVEFTSIPSSYTDLLLLVSARSAVSGTPSIRMRFNSDTGSNYTNRYLEGNGATVISGSESTTNVLIGNLPGTGATANTFASIDIYVPNYSGSANKSVSATSAMETNATTAYLDAIASLWSSTAAITIVTAFTTSNMAIGSSFFLYGITKA